MVEFDLAATELRVHPDLPAIPVWGFGADGEIASPGPLLEGRSYQQVTIRWRNRLPGSVYPQDPRRPVPQLPFATSVVEDLDGATNSVQKELGAQAGKPKDTPVRRSAGRRCTCTADIPIQIPTAGRTTWRRQATTNSTLSTTPMTTLTSD
jgi:hypothetical protein